MPGIGVAEEAVKLMKSSLGDNDRPGIVDADMAYFANSLADRLHEPTRELGFIPSTEYRIDRIGTVRGERGGVQFIDGGMFCPSTPKHLRTAFLDERTGKIDQAVRRIRVEERNQFKVHIKQKPNEQGKFRVSCPARGAAPTVACPIMAMSPKASTDPTIVASRGIVEEVPDFLPDICRQHAITMDVKDNLRYEQAYDYGSPEWEAFHTIARQSIESINSSAKHHSNGTLDTPSQRRSRGFVAGAFFSTILLVTFNISRIAAFLHDELERDQSTPPSDKPARATIRRRDRVFFNPYTKTLPPGTKPPEYIEERRKKRAAKKSSGESGADSLSPAGS